MSRGSRVLLSVRVKATPSRAFTAFTEEIGQWWKPNGLFEFRRGKAGALSFEPIFPHGDWICSSCG